jgi:hypothetical protein
MVGVAMVRPSYFFFAATFFVAFFAAFFAAFLGAMTILPRTILDCNCSANVAIAYLYMLITK